MNKVLHLASCDTCQRIINELSIRDSFELQNIKEKHISAKELDLLFKESGSYEALFNKRARKYRAQGLHEQEIQDKEFRQLILEEYTFLKRPVIFAGNATFVGNSKKVVEAAKKAIS